MLDITSTSFDYNIATSVICLLAVLDLGGV